MATVRKRQFMSNKYDVDRIYHRRRRRRRL